MRLGAIYRSGVSVDRYNARSTGGPVNFFAYDQGGIGALDNAATYEARLRHKTPCRPTLEISRAIASGSESSGTSNRGIAAIFVKVADSKPTGAAESPINDYASACDRG